MSRHQLSAAGLKLRSQLEDSVDGWVIAGLLAALGSSREPAALPVLLSYLLSDDPLVARAAVEATHRILASTPLSDLVWLDQALRPSLFYTRVYQRAWVNLRPEDLDRLRAAPGRAVSSLARAWPPPCAG